MILAAVLVLALLAGGGTWWWLQRTAGADQTLTAGQLVAARTRTVDETVSATGAIEPATEADLVFAQAGKVTAVDVKVGDTVTAGQALASIDPTSLQAAATLAGQQLTAAQAQLTAATAAASSTQIASANAQVTAAQTKLTAAQQALAQATLTTPIAGTVALVNIAVGDTVPATGSTSGPLTTGSGAGAPGSGAGVGSAAGQGSAPGSASGSSPSGAKTAQVVVISTSSWVVDATVGVSDLPKLHDGLAATVTPTGGAQPVSGTVATVGVVGTTSGGTSTFPVTIAVAGSPSGLFAGTTADVVITVRQIPDVLTVPTAAIHQDNGQTVVYQLKDGTQVSTPVTVGGVYGAVTQVVNGLRAGDEVVVAGRAGRAATGTGTGTGTGTATGGPATTGGRLGTGGLGSGGLGTGGLGSGGIGGGRRAGGAAPAGPGAG